MYSKLADRIKEFYRNKDVNIRIAARDIYNKATGGGSFSVQEAVSIRDAFFPGVLVEELFEPDTNQAPQLTTAEVIKIMTSTPCWLEVYPQLHAAVYSYVSGTIQGLHNDKGSAAAVAYALLVGRAQGIREERARRRAVTE